MIEKEFNFRGELRERLTGLSPDDFRRLVITDVNIVFNEFIRRLKKDVRYIADSEYPIKFKESTLKAIDKRAGEKLV